MELPDAEHQSPHGDPDCPMAGLKPGDWNRQYHAVRIDGRDKRRGGAEPEHDGILPPARINGIIQFRIQNALLLAASAIPLHTNSYAEDA